MSEVKRSIILLVGPPGSGKSTFALKLLNENSEIIQRDKIYRDNKIKLKSHNKAKILTHEYMLDKLRNSSKTLIIDSVNATSEGRDFFIKEGKFNDVTIYNFKFKSNLSTEDKAKYLVNRIKERINHPTFPKNKEDQIKIMMKIIPIIEYDNNAKDIFIEDLK